MVDDAAVGLERFKDGWVDGRVMEEDDDGNGDGAGGIRYNERTKRRKKWKIGGKSR